MKAGEFSEALRYEWQALIVLHPTFSPDQMTNISTSLSFFAVLPIFTIGAGKKAPENTMTQFKRQWRELSDAHKEKISQSSSGKPKSTAHRQHISQSMKQYWRGVPHRPDDEHLSMDEYLGISERKPTEEK